jgi:hypothetical protein
MKIVTTKIQERAQQLYKTGKLFEVKLSGRDVWNLYLKSFSKENDPIFRDPSKTVHDCNHCKNFIRRYGNIVAIDSSGNLMSIFNIELPEDSPYREPMRSLDKAITSSTIKDVFFETFTELNSLPYEVCKKTLPKFRLGVESNTKTYTELEAKKYRVVKPGELRVFNHFYLDLPSEYVNMSGKSIESIRAFYRDKYTVFKRALNELTIDTLNLVIDLIKQGSLLDGTAHLHSVQEMLKEKTKYELCKDSTTIDNWLWNHSYEIEERTAKFKNTLIGVLCTELDEGVELNKACLSWNKRVDPSNYMRAIAPITERQKQKAYEFAESNGYLDSFNRRLATLEDIKVTEIKHINEEGDEKLKKISVFDKIKTSSTSRHKRSEFDKVEKVHIDKFMKDILPGCSKVEVLLENRMEGNLVTLTTAQDENSKGMFKWDNPYSWSFKGNLAGKSMIEESINKRGGKTDGVLNVRLHFPNSTTDYDLCISEPNGNRITYPSRRVTHKSSGTLDLDAQGMDGSFPPDLRVENINYTSLSKMPKGDYYVEIDNYGGGSNNGFILEVKSMEGLSKYKYESPIVGKRNSILKISFDGQKFEESIVNNKLLLVDSEHLSKDLYGLETGKFQQVNLICLSPNHWGDNNVGNKHFLFMLDKCTATEPVRGFYNENLNSELAKERKVLEVLGAASTIDPKGRQLSGVGFNSTVRDNVILRLGGTHKRVVNVEF